MKVKELTEFEVEFETLDRIFAELRKENVGLLEQAADLRRELRNHRYQAHIYMRTVVPLAWIGLTAPPVAYAASEDVRLTWAAIGMLATAFSLLSILFAQLPTWTKTA